MKNKLKIQDALGVAGQTPKGFIRQYVVVDFSGAKSVVKVFSKNLSDLSDTGELIVDCNEFCFIAAK
jgi:hypothetical protein